MKKNYNYYENGKRLLLSAVFLVIAMQTSYSQFTKIHDFKSFSRDVARPNTSGPISDGTYLYGVAADSGRYQMGGIYKCSLDGSTYDTLKCFYLAIGSKPDASPILVGDTLFGTTQYGGKFGTATTGGVLYKINKNGSGFDTLHCFNPTTDGSILRGSVSLYNGSLYGATVMGGLYGWGTMFKFNLTTRVFTKLIDLNFPRAAANQEGYAGAPMLIVNDTIYATVCNGGTQTANNRGGVLFKMRIDTVGGITVIKQFNLDAGTLISYPYPVYAEGDTLIGIASTSTTGNNGGVYKIHKNGTGYRVLTHTQHTSWPLDRIAMVGNVGYSLCTWAPDGGAIERYTIDNPLSWQRIHSFAPGGVNTNGVRPRGRLCYVNGSFYGVTRDNGNAGGNWGVIFKYTLPVAPTINAPSIAIDSIRSDSAKLVCKKGNGSYRMMFISKGSVGLPSIVDPQVYTANKIFGTGTQAGSGWYCVYNGTDTAVTVSGLSQDTTYRVVVCEYNNNGTANINAYLVSGMRALNFTMVSPTIQTNGISFSSISNAGGLIKWNKGNGQRSVVFALQGSSGTPTIADSTTYTANTAFGTGTQAGTGWYCIYNSTDTSTSITGLTASTSYLIAVVTYNLVGGEERYLKTYTLDVNIDTLTTNNRQDQVITFDVLADKTFGDAAFTLSAAGGASGNPVTFTVDASTVVTLSGTNNTTVTIVGAGVATITANQLGNNDYADATPVSRTLTVNKATQTITFGALTNKTYGDATFALTATGGASGNAVTYASSNTAVASISGANVTIAGAGSTNITASQASSSNYLAATDVVQALTVGKATLTATAENASRDQGAANPVFTITYTGFVGTDNADGIDTKPTASCTADATSAAGTYDITVSGGTDNNYTFTYVNGTLTVVAVDGIQDSRIVSGNLYPNPVTARLYVKLQNRLNEGIVEIFSISGSKLGNYKLENGTVEIDMNQYQAGSYLVKVITSDGISVQKIVKE